MPFFATHVLHSTLAAALLLAPTVWAEQRPETEHLPAEEEGHRHFFGGFVGATRGPGEIGGTVGLEYEYFPAERFGVGLVAESVGGDINENVFVALAYFHPVERLGLFAGGGWDRRLKLEQSSGHGTASASDSDGELHGRRPLARVGAAHEIAVGGRVVAVPSVAVDFVRGEAIVVFGVTVGFFF